jgi:integrase/recombinase XerD
METVVYTKHSPKCPQKSNKFFRRCKCRKWIYISRERKRIAAKTRSWEQAERQARQLTGEATAADYGGQTVREAVKLFLEDKHEQALSKNWEGKLKREMVSLDEWSTRKGLVLLSELSLQHLEQYRKEWKGAPVTRRKRQERLRSFFLYCCKHKWVSENLAANLSTIKVTDPPTLPLTKEQFASVLAVVPQYNPKAADREWRRQRATAMLLLLRWSGLRLGDASRLERVKLSKDGNLLLYMQKTGEGVYVPLPSNVVKCLRELKNPNPKYFFWNGTSAKDSTVVRWWTTLKAIFRLASLEGAHPHMLRDTFAVHYLLAGMPLDQVSILLGHSSVRITERHYSPWVRARQQQLEDSVRKAWEHANQTA